MAGLEVAGRRFRTEEDFRAALRDQAKIEKIRAQIDMEQPGEVIRLYIDMQSGRYRFETAVGNDFDDEIYELAQTYKRQGYTKESKLPVEKKKKPIEKFTRKKETADFPKEPDQKAVTARSHTSGIDDQSDVETVTIDQYDEEMQSVILQELHKREKRRRLMVILCSTVAILCFGYFGIYCYFADRTENDYADLASLKGNTALAVGEPTVTIHRTGDKEVELTVLEEYQTLYNKNKSLIGWLKIADTNIDYPVMQTVNNEYYLDHNYTQEYDKNGSLFLDKDCDIVHRNTNLIIYGHHMKSGKMFGNLNKYSSEDYAKQHATIQFDTIYEKGTYEVMYVFRSRIYNEEEIVFKYYQFFDAASEKEFNSNMQEMAALSLYDTGVTASYGDELLTLSTCDNSEQDGRFVVVAKRVE